jgi:hypothetical protein
VYFKSSLAYIYYVVHIDSFYAILFREY